MPPGMDLLEFFNQWEKEEAGKKRNSILEEASCATRQTILSRYVHLLL